MVGMISLFWVQMNRRIYFNLFSILSDFEVGFLSKAQRVLWAESWTFSWDLTDPKFKCFWRYGVTINMTVIVDMFVVLEFNFFKYNVSEMLCLEKEIQGEG
jgi:hypothetical protein